MTQLSAQVALFLSNGFLEVPVSYNGRNAVYQSSLCETALTLDRLLFHPRLIDLYDLVFVQTVNGSVSFTASVIVIPRIFHPGRALIFCDPTFIIP